MPGKLDYNYKKFADEWWEQFTSPVAHKQEDEGRDRKWLKLIKEAWNKPAVLTALLKPEKDGPGGGNANREARDDELAKVDLHQKHIKNNGPNTPRTWNDPENVEIWIVEDDSQVPVDYDPHYDPDADKSPPRLYRVIPPLPAGADEQKLALLALPGYVHQMRQMYGALTGAV